MRFVFPSTISHFTAACLALNPTRTSEGGAVTTQHKVLQSPIFALPWLLPMSQPGLRRFKAPISVRAFHRQWRFGYKLGTSCHKRLDANVHVLPIGVARQQECTGP